MFELTCNIQTFSQSGQTIRYNYVENVEIKTSLHNFTDTCTLKVPRKVKHKGKNLTAYIRRGDAVQVKLGYDNRLKTVFKGYIKSVSAGMPIIIECENESYKLKQIKVSARHYDSVGLKKLINEILPGYDAEISDMNLGELRIRDEVSVAGVLDYLKKNYPLQFYFRGDVFYAGLPTALLARDQQTLKLQKGKNRISDSLTYTLAEDIKVQIVVKSILKDNTKLEHKEPAEASDADIRTFYVPGAESLADLKSYAKEKLSEFKADKTEGSLKAFGEPYIRKGDIVHLFDNDNAELNDKRFLAESVNYSFGQSGYRQNITLGNEIR